MGCCEDEIPDPALNPSVENLVEAETEEEIPIILDHSVELA